MCAVICSHGVQNFGTSANTPVFLQLNLWKLSSRFSGLCSEYQLEGALSCVCENYYLVRCVLSEMFEALTG